MQGALGPLCSKNSRHAWGEPDGSHLLRVLGALPWPTEQHDASDDEYCWGSYVDEADVDDADAGSDGGRDAGWGSESDLEAMDYDSP